MYRHCIYCATDLGGNEAVEPFPVGRRLAFDGAKGRLWVVCRVCERWNLSPLEERWEAIDACERAFRDTRRRVSTENIGLARLREGLDLVRIGEPLRPEFAAWRYGDQFGRRRRRYMVGAGAAGAGSLAVYAGFISLVGLSLAGLPFSMLSVYMSMRQRRAKRKKGVPVLTEEGKRVVIFAPEIAGHRIQPLDRTGEWALEVYHDGGKLLLHGQRAVHILGRSMPKINAFGGSLRQVRRAVAELESVPDPTLYFREAELKARKLGWGHQGTGAYPAHIRLALEMAAHEEVEREVIHGELELLEEAWREAEEIAAIADDLTLSDQVRAALERLKQRHSAR